MIEGESDEFITFFFVLKKEKSRFGVSSASVRRQVVYKSAKLQALKGFTINLCLSREELKEKSVYFIQVCMYSLIFFIWGEMCCVRTSYHGLSGGSVVMPPSSSCLVSPSSSSVSVNLSLALLE